MAEPRSRIEKIEARLDELEAKRIELKELPLAALRNKLARDLKPDADTFLLPKSVGNDSLEDGAVNTRVLGVLTTIGWTPVAAAGVANDTLFVDSGDGKLKFKDGGGVVNALY